MNKPSGSGLWTLSIGFVLLVGLALWLWFRTPSVKSLSGAAASSTTAPDLGYLQAGVCKDCHPQIWETYQRTGMGRSFARIDPENLPTELRQTVSFYHKASDQHYTILQRDGRVYQRRYQTGFGGAQANVEEKEIHLVVGSGNHVRTFLHKTKEGRIYELPLGWYAEGGGVWGMNPGYDRPDHDNFRRQITGQCMFCHNGYPEIEPGGDSSGSAPVFRGYIPSGIDCQRCHGPGRAHVDAVRAGNSRESIRQSILNPARLSSERQMELCMQCHLETTSFRLPQSIVRYSRGIFSYRPGEPLNDYMLHFDHPSGTGHDDKFEIAHAAYRLRKSACFLKSNGGMQCTTCHNPHDIPRGSAAQQHYTNVCRNCHSATLQRLSAANQHLNSGDCLGCHMPKRRTDDVVHAVMTDHWIQRRRPSGDLLAPRAERIDSDVTAYKGEVAPYYPAQLTNLEDRLYLAVAQVRQGSNLARGIPQLEELIRQNPTVRGEFFFELGESYWNTGNVSNALQSYEEAVKRVPGFLPGRRKLASALAKSGQTERAVALMEKIVADNPNDPVILNDLGLMRLSSGTPAESVRLFRKALELDPDLADSWNNLGGALLATKEVGGAEEAYRNAIRIQPDLAGAHQNLAGLLSSGANFGEAEFHYQKAIRSNPAWKPGYYEYGTALAQRQRYADAARQFEALLRLDPADSRAANSLGDMIAMQGHASAAIKYYRRALELQPDFAAASMGLGSVLAELGKVEEALPHLERAARSSDPEIRDAALNAIRSLRNGAPSNR